MIQTSKTGPANWRVFFHHDFKLHLRIWLKLTYLNRINLLKALQFQNSNSTAKDLAFREALLGKSPACILLLHTDVASFSNFLATFDQDLWQALILKWPFSVNATARTMTTISGSS